MVSRLGFLGVLARLFMWAFLLSLAVVVLYPLLWMVLNGFKTNAELFGNPFALPTDLSFGNYRDAWNRGVSDYLATSLLVTVTSTVATVFISAWAAYGLTRVDIPLNKVLTAVILGGLMLTPTVALVPLVRMFQSLGLYNSFWALLILYTAFRVPFTTFLIRAYMIDLPREVDEVAQLDGAGRWTAFWRIILPMCKPIITSTVLLHVLFAWNEYLFAATLTSVHARTITTGLAEFVTVTGTNWGQMAATAMLTLLPALLFLGLAQRHIVAGLTFGAVKG